MFDSTPFMRQMIAKAFEVAADNVLKEHYGHLAQEHQITSRIAQNIEREINNSWFGPLRVNVDFQELPEKGRGALERRLGGDLFVNVRLDDGFEEKAKGLLIQAKWHDKIGKNVPRTDVKNQCRDMLGKTKSAYVWSYGPAGVQTINAQDIIDRTSLHMPPIPMRRNGDVFDEIIKCNEGDTTIGVRSSDNIRNDIAQRLRELAVSTAIDIEIDKPPM